MIAQTKFYPKQAHIILATGGTGGHIFPAEALIAGLHPTDIQLGLITDERGYNYGGLLGRIKRTKISARGLSGGSFAKAIALLHLMRGFCQAFLHLKRLRPDIVIGFGGYPSLPTIMAANLLGIKTILHEQNAVLGRANRLLAAGADHIATAFEKTEMMRNQDRAKMRWTGNPVRPEIARLFSTRNYAPPLADGPINLLIFGGSQGAARFADLIPAALNHLPEKIKSRLRVTQQVRPNQLETLKAHYANYAIDAKIAHFFDTMPALFAQAHLVIARAGASTVAELAAAKVPAIFIPYPYATDNHQAVNAMRLCDAGGGWLMAESELSVEKLTSQLNFLLANPNHLKTASSALEKIAMPYAGENLAQLVMHTLDQAVHQPPHSQTKTGAHIS